MRILVAFPGHVFATRDIASGYLKALNSIDGITAHGYAYHDSLAFYSTAVQEWQKLGYAEGWPESAAYIFASERTVIEVLDFVPDVVLVVHGMAIHARAWDLINRLGIPIFLLATESPYLDEAQITLAKRMQAKGILTNDKYSTVHMAMSTDLPVTYLPHSYDPEIHYPGEYERMTDVFFFGTLWPERKELFKPLIDAGYDIGGLDHDKKESFTYLTNEELAEHYRHSKIVINHHRTLIGGDDNGDYHHIQRGAAYSLNPRAYEAPACGAVTINDNTRPELTEVYQECGVSFSNGNQLLELVDYLLKNDDARQELASKALDKVAPCTYQNRAKDILLPFLERHI